MNQLRTQPSSLGERAFEEVARNFRGLDLNSRMQKHAFLGSNMFLGTYSILVAIDFKSSQAGSKRSQPKRTDPYYTQLIAIESNALVFLDKIFPLFDRKKSQIWPVHEIPAVPPVVTRFLIRLLCHFMMKIILTEAIMNCITYKNKL